MGPDDELTIGQVARRAGVAPSALRFYEDRGLIRPLRTAGNQRRYPRSALRIISVIKAAQAVGLTLEEVETALSTLPDRRTPTKADWGRLSRAWRKQLDERIQRLERLRDDLDGCIGCGCLSLRSCALFNPEDADALQGPGARRLLQPRRRSPSSG
ncbi:MAG: redox-sensitive transcriptional activator SoxR [Myxococcota bacterium]